MSSLDAMEPVCTERADQVNVLIEGKAKDLGGFSVRRVLPAAMAPSVGPFVFFDEMGPADFPPGEGINVRPHPHIGLATVTFLLEGEIMHRDSLGFVQAIQPGAVNLMTAGRGIVHSERTSEARLAAGQRLHGMQVWMALPEAQQEIDPAFVHHPADSLPRILMEGVTTTVIIGSYAGETSPVAVFPETIYLAQELEAGASAPLPAGAAERAIYVARGSVAVGGCSFGAGTMAVLNGTADTVSADEPSYIMVIGGESMGPRRLWWNFVSTSRERIEAAKADWREGRFDSVPGDEEFIPLP